MNIRATYQNVIHSSFAVIILQEGASSASYHKPYRLSAKELDQEPSRASSRTPLKNKTWGEQTGNYYYGARYYNPTCSVWLSVDPLSNLNPDQTPYHFVSNNLVMRIDPYGLTDFENSETGEIISVEDGMNQSILVDPKNWLEVVDFSQLEDGNNPSGAYNSFIVANNGVSVPTSKSSGVILDKEMFLGFMIFKAQNEWREVAAFEVEALLDNTSHSIVQPWENNLNDWSQNSSLEITSRGYKRGIAQYHTHPYPTSFKNGCFQSTQLRSYMNFPGLSEVDMEYSKSNGGIPAHAIYPDGSIYQGSRTMGKEMSLPRYTTHDGKSIYGQKIR